MLLWFRSISGLNYDLLDHTSKAAVNHLTAQLAVTLAKKNIQYVSFRPRGFVIGTNSVALV